MFIIVSLPDISKWNTNKVSDMSFMVFGCSSLFYLPDISKWNTNNLIEISLMFTKCISLISLPDISKWNTKNLINMKCLITDCLSLTFIPDINNWNNYNEGDVNEEPDYVKINKIVNVNSKLELFASSPEDFKILNNKEFLDEQKIELFDMLYN